MACIENVCNKADCEFRQFSNDLLKVCPMCGGGMSNFFDEQLLENESPSGDDDIDFTDEDD